MKKILLTGAIILAVIFSVSCKGNTTPELPPYVPPPDVIALPVIVNFTVTPESCLYNKELYPYLSWNVTGATEVALKREGDDRIFKVKAQVPSYSWGLHEVNVATTTVTWTLTASNSHGAVSKSCTLTITHAALVMASFAVSDFDKNNIRKITGTIRNDGDGAGRATLYFMKFSQPGLVYPNGQLVPAYPPGHPNTAFPLLAPGQSTAFESYDYYNWYNTIRVDYEITWGYGTTGWIVLWNR